MPDKIEQLEQLVSQVLSRQATLQAHNKMLTGRLHALEQTAEELKAAQAELKELRAWKKNTQNTLRRLSAKIDKELEKQKQAQDKIA